MTVFLVIGEEPTKHGLRHAATLSEKVVTTTYAELVNEPHHLGNIVYPSPGVILLTGTPAQQYAVDFAKVLSKMTMIPCDRKGKCFTRRKAPHFIFCIDPPHKPLEIPEELKVINV